MSIPSGNIPSIKVAIFDQEGSGATKASAIISELISSISPGKQLYSSALDNAQQQQQQQQQYNKRRSLVERPSSTSRKSSWDKPIPQQQTSPSSGVTVKSNYHYSNDLSSPTTTADTYLDTSNPANSTTTATTLSSPSSSTTPLPFSHTQQHQLLSQANNNSATSGVKGKLKKAMNALNSFIVAASANMKRKHRSSMIENHWSIPSMIKSSLKLDNLFNVQELKRQLVEKAKEIQLAQSQMLQQQYTLLGKHQLAPLLDTTLPFSKRTASNNMFVANTKPVLEQTSSSYPLNKTLIGGEQTTTTSGGQMSMLSNNKTKTNQAQAQTLNPITIGNSSTNSQVSAVTDLSEDVTASSQLETPVSSQLVPNKAQYQTIPEMTALQDSHSPKISIVSTKSLFVADSTNNKQAELQPVASTDKTADVNNSTRHHLEVCLNQFLCRLTVKLSKSLKNTHVNSAAHTNVDNRSQNSSSTPITSDHVERLTKKYINQLVEQIETENPSLKLNSKIMPHPDISVDNDDEPKQYWNNTRQHESPLDTLYKNAMKNRCSMMYNCVELLQLERTLSKMKLKLS